MEVESLLPEVGLELFKTVCLRERYLTRVKTLLDNKKGFVDLSVIGLVDLLRDTTLSIVETVVTWERAQIDFPRDVKPYLWNGLDYLVKMRTDVDFLVNYPQFVAWLGFSPVGNPFLVPTEVFLATLHLLPHSYLVFGRKPDKDLQKTKKKNKLLQIKSPYTTPIINDPEVFTHLSVKNQLNRKFSALGRGEKSESEGGKDGEYDPYLCYLSSEQLHRMRSSLEKLHSRWFPADDLPIGGGAAGLEISQSVGESELMDTFPSQHLAPPFTPSQSLVQNSVVIGEDAMASQILLRPSILEESISRVQGESSFAKEGSGFQIESDLIRGNGEPNPQSQQMSRFEQTKDAFFRDITQQQSMAFYDSLDLAQNDALRLQKSSIGTSKDATGPYSIVNNDSTMHWTPHEIHLQRQVQRRGGELYVLTAAGKRNSRTLFIFRF